MEFKIGQHGIHLLSQRVRYLIILCGSLIFCNALLAILLWYQSNNRQVILVPTGFHKSAEIGQSNVSASYLEQYALFFVNERLNVTPDSVDASDLLVLDHTASKYYATFRTLLTNEKNIIQKQKISSAFYLSMIQVDTRNLKVLIEGKLQRWVGERSLGSSQKRYQLHFIEQGGELLLASFREIPENKG